MSESKMLGRKAISALLVLFFMNSIFILFSPEVFYDLLTLVPITLLSGVVCIDIAIRPVSTQRDRFSRVLLGSVFLLFPLMVAMPYFERRYVTMLYIPRLIDYVFPIGVIILLLGSIILLVSRIQIGKYGGPKITIETNHHLITDGMYGTIRNPQYLGFLLILPGYSLSLGSSIVTVVTFTSLFLIFRNRIALEEQLLLDTFGKEYVEYMQRTWRLFPLVY